MTAHNLKDLTGQKFGKLTVIKKAENDKYGRSMWLCECDCGGKNVVLGYYLKTGRVKSCGCIKNRKTNGRTLFKKIKIMTVDEMAEYLHEITTCGFCPAEDLCDKAVENEEDYACTKIIKQYLLQEVEE